MSREFWTFCIYSLLSVVIMNGTFQWLDEKKAMTSDVALQKAESTLDRVYKNAAGMRLTEVTAPTDKKENWQFRFQPSQGRAITVEVAKSGQTSIAK